MPDAAFEVQLDHQSWRALQRDLAKLGPEIEKQLRTTVKGFAGVVASAARSNASWSSRIPGAIGVTVTKTRVGVKVNRRKAPHARAFEGIQTASFGQRGSFRHPLFGDREHWFNQTTRPFLAPAVQANSEAFFAAAGKAVDSAARIAGWH